MNFETKLKELVERYAVFPEAEAKKVMINTLREVLQARRIEYHNKTDFRTKNYCQFSIVAPGLQKYCGDNVGWNKEATIYQGRNGEQALPSTENGFVTMYLLCEDKDFSEVRLDFSNKIKLPEYETKFNKIRCIYSYQAKNGSFYVNSGEDVYAEYRKNEPETSDGQGEKVKDIAQILRGESILDINLVLRCDAINGVRVKKDHWGTELLSRFFEDVGYNGLDKLIER